MLALVGIGFWNSFCTLEPGTVIFVISTSYILCSGIYCMYSLVLRSINKTWLGLLHTRLAQSFSVLALVIQSFDRFIWLNSTIRDGRLWRFRVVMLQVMLHFSNLDCWSAEKAKCTWSIETTDSLFHHHKPIQNFAHCRNPMQLLCNMIICREPKVPRFHKHWLIKQGNGRFADAHWQNLLYWPFCGLNVFSSPSRQPEPLRDIGLNLENCKLWLECAVLTSITIMIILIVVHVHTHSPPPLSHPHN